MKIIVYFKKNGIQNRIDKRKDFGTISNSISLGLFNVVTQNARHLNSASTIESSLKHRSSSSWMLKLGRNKHCKMDVKKNFPKNFLVMKLMVNEIHIF